MAAPQLGSEERLDALGHAFRALRRRSFRLFIGGQVVDAERRPKLAVYRLTHSELLLGTAWFCSQIAVFALGRVLGLMAVSTLAGMPVLVLTPFFADDILHKGSQGLGFLLGAMAIGAVVGTLILARRTRVSGLPAVMTYSGVFVGCAYLAFALSPSYAFSLAVMPLMGVFVRQMASANTTIQTLIPDRYRVRIMALYSMSVVGLGPFGSLAAGALASYAGARVTVAIGSFLAAGAAVVFGLSHHRRPIAA
jgi:MFS family permease